MALGKTLHGWKLPAIGAAGLVMALIAVLSGDEEAPKSPPVSPPVSPYTQAIAGIGVVEPQGEVIAVSPELPGVIREIAVEVGDRVAQGDLLFALDMREIDAQIAVLEAQLASAKVQAAEAVAQFSLVQHIDDPRAVARDDFNRRKYGSELAKARVAEIDAQLGQAHITKERLQVRAPIGGNILDLNVRVGEYASVNPINEPLVRMGYITPLHVRVEFDEEYAARLKPGAEAQATPRGDTQRTIPLTFLRFEPLVRPKQNLVTAGQRVDTRVIEAIYVLPEDAGGLFVGQQLDVFVKGADDAK